MKCKVKFENILLKFSFLYICDFSIITHIKQSAVRDNYIAIFPRYFLNWLFIVVLTARSDRDCHLLGMIIQPTSRFVDVFSAEIKRCAIFSDVASLVVFS